MSADVAPRTEPGTTRRPLGYALVVLSALLIGGVGIFPFLILVYTVVQWVLAPLGLAAADTSNDDGVVVQLVAGVLVPLAVVATWAGLVRWLTRRFTLTRSVAWPLAVIALVLPVTLFILERY